MKKEGREWNDTTHQGSKRVQGRTQKQDEKDEKEETLVPLCTHPGSDWPARIDLFFFNSSFVPLQLSLIHISHSAVHSQVLNEKKKKIIPVLIHMYQK